MSKPNGPDAQPGASAASIGTVSPLQPDYLPRHLRFRTRLRLGDWTVKLYGVSVGRTAISAELANAAAAVAAKTLPTPATTDARYGVAFVVAHESIANSYVLVSWWDERNEVHQRIFSAPVNDPSRLRPHDSPAIGCVWELAVTDFERRAWIEDVLKPADNTSVDRYLSRELNADV